MNVEVSMLLSDPPEKERLDDLLSAAQSLALAPNCIKVHAQRDGKYHELITRFSMKKSPQYKVIDQINNFAHFGVKTA